MTIKQQEISWQVLEAADYSGKQSLLVRLVFMVSFVALFSLMMNTLLNYIHFTKTYENILYETFYTEAENIAANLEAGLKLGIRLSHLANGRTLLVQAQHRNSNILFLSLESKGRVIHHVGGQGRCKRTKLSNYLVVRYPIKNSFGQIAGQLCLGYDPAPVRQKEASVRQNLIEKTGFLFLGLIILITLILGWLTHRVRKELKTLYQTIHHVQSHINGLPSQNTWNRKQEAEVDLLQLNLPVKDFCQTVKRVAGELERK